MIFNIYDTAWHSDREKPCENAIDVTPEGKKNKEWEIEINNINELMALTREVGNPLVIFANDDEPDWKPSIEIYNNYRE